MAESSKLAVVTGSSKGIGRGILTHLRTRGWDAFVTGRSRHDIDSICSEEGTGGSGLLPFVGDLTTDNAVNELANQVGAQGRPLDLLIANLGSGRPLNNSQWAALEIRRLFEINFFSAISVCDKLIPFMKGGNIIFISSIAGCESMEAPLGYSAAKAALLAYSKRLSDLLASQKIRVNSISPGNVFFEGGVWSEKEKKDPVGTARYLKEKVPLDAFASLKSIAQGVQFIIDNDFYTGQNLIIDGGQTRGFI